MNWFEEFGKQERTLASGEDFLDFLAAAGRKEVPTEALGRWVFQHMDLIKAASTEEKLLSAFDAIPVGVPDSHDAQVHWLVGIQRVALAYEGLYAVLKTDERNGFSWWDSWEWSTGARLAKLADTVKSNLGRLDSHSALAKTACARFGPIEPWILIPGGDHGVTNAVPGTERAWVQAWVWNAENVPGVKHLSATIDQWLREQVRTNRYPWHAEYIAAVTRAAKVAVVDTKFTMRQFGTWIARSLEPEVVAEAGLLLRIPLPHLGDKARLTARRHVDGTVWTDPTRTEKEPVLVPRGITSYAWGDDVIGEFVSTIHQQSVPLFKEMSLRVSYMAEQAKKQEGAYNDDILSLIEDFREGGILYKELLRAAEYMRECRRTLTFNEPVPVDIQEWVLLAVKGRIALERIILRLKHPPGLEHPDLRQALNEADTVCEEVRDAVLLLDEKTRTHEIGGHIDPNKWWNGPGQTQYIP